MFTNINFDMTDVYRCVNSFTDAILDQDSSVVFDALMERDGYKFKEESYHDFYEIVKSFKEGKIDEKEFTRKISTSHVYFQCEDANEYKDLFSSTDASEFVELVVIPSLNEKDYLNSQDYYEYFANKSDLEIADEYIHQEGISEYAWINEDDESICLIR